MILVLTGCQTQSRPSSSEKSTVQVTVFAQVATQTSTVLPPTATPIPTATSEPTAQPVPTPIPLIVVAPSQADTLPAPVYYLYEDRNKTQQIWRLERDGLTKSQITNESANVRDFDVSPTDGALAYVSGFDLFVANADGTERRSVLHDENAVDSANEDQRRAGARYHSPLWFPNGQQIALADYRGVIFVTLDGQTRRFQTNILPPPSRPAEMNVAYYRPGQFSPDGLRLLLHVGVWERDILSIKDIDATDSVEPLQLKDTTFCEPVWSIDQKIVYCASGSVLSHPNRIGMSNANTGKTSEMIQVEDEQFTEFEFFKAPFPASNGDLFYLKERNPIGMRQFRLSLFRINPRNNSAPIEVRSEVDVIDSIGETLWDVSGQGLIIKAGYFDTTGAQQSGILWLPIDGSAAIRLRLEGNNLHWGSP